jgi:signal transduction histidine kinase
MAAVGLAALLLWLAMRHARREAAMQARAAQAAKLEALGSLTSGVAHDFNNLLQAMGSALRLLGSFTNDDARAAKVIAHGLTSMERSRGLVAQLLGVARPQELEARDVDLNAILSEIAILLENAAAPKARLELDLRADVQPCRADASRLDAAILNLVVNARDAMPPDRPGIGLIRISTANCARAVVSRDGRRVQRGEFVCVTVRDNGVGMPPEVCRRALEPFFTTKGERGTGLGLSQIYAFVRELGGDMQIESEINAGTAVHLYFPRARPQSRQDRQGQAAATHAG